MRCIYCIYIYIYPIARFHVSKTTTMNHQRFLFNYFGGGRGRTSAQRAEPPEPPAEEEGGALGGALRAGPGVHTDTCCVARAGSKLLPWPQAAGGPESAGGLEAAWGQKAARGPKAAERPKSPKKGP